MQHHALAESLEFGASRKEQNSVAKEGRIATGPNTDQAIESALRPLPERAILLTSRRDPVGWLEPGNLVGRETNRRRLTHSLLALAPERLENLQPDSGRAEVVSTIREGPVVLIDVARWLYCHPLPANQSTVLKRFEGFTKVGTDPRERSKNRSRNRHIRAPRKHECDGTRFLAFGRRQQKGQTRQYVAIRAIRGDKSKVKSERESGR